MGTGTAHCRPQSLVTCDEAAGSTGASTARTARGSMAAGGSTRRWAFGNRNALTSPDSTDEPGTGRDEPPEQGGIRMTDRLKNQHSYCIGNVCSSYGMHRLCEC